MKEKFTIFRCRMSMPRQSPASRCGAGGSEGVWDRFQNRAEVDPQDRSRSLVQQRS